MNGESGFSLVEMMVAVAIMGLLATLAVLGLKGWGDQGNLQAATSTLVGTLREAQLRAEGQHTCYRVDWQANGTGGQQLDLKQSPPAPLPDSPSTSIDDCPDGASWNTVRTFDLPNHVLVNASPIQFDKSGLPAGGANATVQLSVGSESVTVTLYGATGAVVTSH